MPNFDTGHYFLTMLSPIRQGMMPPDEDGKQISYVQNLKRLLNALQTAKQSPATQSVDLEEQDKNNPFVHPPETGDDKVTRKNEEENSPFVLSKRTHICRFMVLDDVVYNGRNQRNALLTKLKMKLQKVKVLNPLLQPQPVDRLSCAYLMFTAEIDASLKPEDDLPNELTKEQQDEIRDTYARELWRDMPAEIGEIYKNCEGLCLKHGKSPCPDHEQGSCSKCKEGFIPKSAEDCVEYMRACQVETTMPFNDYWEPQPELEKLPNKLPMNIIRPLVLIPLGVTLLALLGWIFRLDWFPLGWLFGWSAGWTFLIGLLLSAAALYGAYLYILSNGNKPMPASQYGDLPSVLKSLYIQQHFADFAIAVQGKSDEELYAAFGQFINAHKPENKMSPSQLPGVIASIKRGEKQ